MTSLDSFKKRFRSSLPVILSIAVFAGVWVFTLWGNPNVFAEQSSEGVKYFIQVFDGVSQSDAVRVGTSP